MAYLSAGVYVLEQDSSAIVPNVTSNIAFFAGEFEQGPVGVPYVVTTKQEYENVFGRPTNDNYGQWFQGYKFLDYGNQLIITRAYTEYKPQDPQNPTLVQEPIYIGEVEIDSASGIRLIYDKGLNTELPKFQEGDVMSLGNETEVLQVTNIETNTAGIGCSYAIELQGTTTYQDGDKVDLYLHSAEHKNGETEAFFRGPVDETMNIPTLDMANMSTNVDWIDSCKTMCFSDNRLSETYNLIKSEDDWDYYYTMDANPLANFKRTETKVKFYNKTPGAQKVEVAIANWYDFLNEYDINGNPYNNAIAFREEVIDGVYENWPLQDLFQYYPSENQVAIAIKSGSEIETFIVSFDPQSIDGNGQSDYIETVINENSKFLYCLENSSIVDLPASYLACDRFGTTTVEFGDISYPCSSDVGPVEVPVSPGVATHTLSVQGGKSPRVTEGDLREAYYTVEDKEKYEIDVIIGNESQNQNIAVDLADTRKDCLAFIGARYEDTVGKKAQEATNAIVKYITEGVNGSKLTRTMFAAFFGNYFRVYDNYNKKYRWISCAGDMAGIRCSVSNINESWWVSAGMKRGIIRGIDRMAFTPSQPMRDFNGLAI